MKIKLSELRRIINETYADTLFQQLDPAPEVAAKFGSSVRLVKRGSDVPEWRVATDEIEFYEHPDTGTIYCVAQAHHGVPFLWKYSRSYGTWTSLGGITV